MNNTQLHNPLLCDPERGVCEIPGTSEAKVKTTLSSKQKPIRIVYFTDPICSSCWGIEPQLRKLKLEYGDKFEIEYHMGGLLPSWENFNGGGITKPSDVARHWDEVSKYYEMPIDGDVWFEDPLPSSYPPSIAFKAAQLQDEEKAIRFLRRIREMVFLEKKNITKWEYIQQAANAVGLNTIQLRTDFDGKAKQLFQNDLDFARKLGVRGFPTMFFTDTLNNQLIVYGFKPYEAFENSILKLIPQAVKNEIDISWESLFVHYPTLTTKEFAVLTNNSRENAEKILSDLFNQHILTKLTTKNGTLWRNKNTTR